MSELLLKEKLRSSEVDDEVRNVARARTIAILFQLDARRIGYVFAFLLETKLMSAESDSNVVSLRGANLRNINLSYAILDDVNLSRADLRGADLRGASLSMANFENTHLDGANLCAVNLFFANLDGSHLNGAILSRAYLYHTRLSRTFLRDADLRYANLDGADLDGAHLNGASLSRVSRYFGPCLRSKNATSRADGKGKPTPIGQARRRLIDPLTQDGEVSIERAVVERA